MMLLVAMINVMWDYREGEAVVMEDILMAKLPELHVEDEQRIHSREPRKIQAAFDSDW
jgi:hypothetical protein